ncbi:MAG TPA: prolipoprotein diacylglyceryl transferase [Anaerolineaceae bacterium]|nr:prolipoprotein diacylglyceryl transferase [Anaerolineaceae bacterium]HPN52490.1 prolipoprotein diacylglyceryl transferase [Anaerolineaceae bacterium]
MEFTSQGIVILGFTIYYYGIVIMLGVVAAAIMTDRLARMRGLDPEIPWDALAWCLIGGIVGARLWHVFTPPPSMVEQGITTMYYLTNPLAMLNIRNGGLGIPGGVIGGALGFYIFARRRKISFLEWADLIAPGLALAQAMGRWGNFFNQEVYGAPTSLPWAITIDPPYRLPEYINQATYHPLFLYESIYNLVSMAVLIWLLRKGGERLKKGDVFLTYLVLYPVGRFFLEFLRLDSAQVGGINFNQTLMGVIAIAAVALLIWRHRPGAATAAAESQPPIASAAAPEPDADIEQIEESVKEKENLKEEEQ